MTAELVVLTDPCGSCRSRTVYCAFIVFGLASWMMADGFLVEMSGLIQRQPEGKALGAYLMVSLQLGNIFPFLYVLLNGKQQRASLENSICFLVLFGALICILTAAFWRVTTHIFRHAHSTGLIVLVFLGSMVSNTTNVVFYPYASRFPSVYTSALGTGEGCSGLLAGILSAIQDPSNPTKMRFSISQFYIIEACVFLLALGAFLFLTKHKWAVVEANCVNVEITPLPVADKDRCTVRTQLIESITPPERTSDSRLVGQIWKVLALQVWLCAIAYGVIPSILPFLCGAYENGPTILQWSSILSMACDPIGRFLTSFFKSYPLYWKGTFITLLAGAMVFQAAGFGIPYMAHARFGGLLPILANCTFTFVFSYTQTMIYLTLKKEVSEEKSATAYQWSGLATQLGGLAGTSLIFPLVTFTNVFKNP